MKAVKMKHLFLACAIIVISAINTTANAGGGFFHFIYHHHHIYKSSVRPPVPGPVKPGGGGSNWTLCPTPAGWVICAIAVGITVRTYQEIQKGCTRDQGNWPARLWMPICGWNDSVSVRG